MKTFISTLLLFVNLFINAQIMDVSINPVGVAMGSPDLTFEYLYSENMSMGVTISGEFGKPNPLSINRPLVDFYKVSGFGYFGNFRYYTEPYEGNDGFYYGFYFRGKSKKYTNTEEIPSYETMNGHHVEYKQTTMATGLYIGRKMLFWNGFIFDFGFGGGYFLLDKRTPLNIPEAEATFPERDGLNGFDLIGILSVGYRF